MGDQTLGVAIHGAGWVARAHAASWARNPNCRIVSVGSRRRESAEAMIQELGLDCRVHDRFEDMLNDSDVDIVNISGPNHVHTEQGIAVAEAGKHMLMEKPMCLSMSENRRLRDAVANAGVRSVVGFVARWNPLVQNLKTLVAQVAVGELFFLEIKYWHGLGPWWSGWEWGRTKAIGGSTMLLAGCHAVDALRWLSGDEVAEVTAVSNNKKQRCEFDANVAAVVKFRNGTIGTTSALFDCEMPYQFNVDLIGTDGTLRDNRVWSSKLFPGQKGWTTMDALALDSGDVEHHPFDAMINNLADSILLDRETDCSIADAYYPHELCLAIDRSVESGGQRICLPLEDE